MSEFQKPYSEKAREEYERIFSPSTIADITKNVVNDFNEEIKLSGEGLTINDSFD